MPRDGSGIYTLPPGTEDMVPGTVIESTVQDSLTGDLQATMNTAWPVSLGGTGGSETASWVVPVGAVGTPGLAFRGDLNTGIYWIGADNIGFAVGGVLELDLDGTRLAPGATDGLALGSATRQWADIFLAGGGVVNFNNNNSHIRDSNGTIMVSTAGTDRVQFGDNYIRPNANDGIALGQTARSFSDLFLATGAVINWNNGTATFGQNGSAITVPQGQLEFPLTQNPSSNANTLDDYEETTWTPALTFGGGSTGITYTSRAGRAIKVGKKVTAWCRGVLSSKGSSTGTALMTGLPYTSETFTNCFFMGPLFLSGLGATGFALIISSGTSVTLLNGAGTTLTDASFSNTSEIFFTIEYMADN
jgi:hypothetical protein